MPESHAAKIPWISLAQYVGAGLIAGGIAMGVRVAHQRLHNMGVEAVTERDRQFKAITDLWTGRPPPKDPMRSLQELRRYPLEELTETQLPRWHATAGKLHHLYAIEHPDKMDEGHITNARRYYYQALEGCTDPALKRELLLGLADTSMMTSQWKQALKYLDKLASVDTTSDMDGTAILKRMDCLIELDQTNDIFELINTFLANDPAGPDRARALMMRGEYRLEAIPPTPSIVQSAVKPRPTQEESDAIRVDFVGALAHFSPTDENRARALNGLLRLCVMTGDADSAYRYIETLQSSILPVDERVRSYLLLSKLEENRNHLNESVLPLRFCIKEFPNSPKTAQVYDRLFRLYRDHGQWQDAIEVLELQSDFVNKPKEILEIVHKIGSGPSSLIHALPELSNRRSLGNRAHKLLQRLDRPEGAAWQRVHEEILYLKGMVAFESEHISEAELGFAKYITESADRMYLESILFRDLLCAIRLPHESAIRAYRAERYLDRFHDHPHSTQAMIHLLQAYYEMGLYRGMLSVGKQAFVTEMIQMGREGDFDRQPEWFQTVAKLAQSYTKLSEFDKANPLFRTCMPKAHRFQCSSAVYLDWAETAQETGQPREALRRLEVAEQAEKDPNKRLPIRIAQHIHLLRMEDDRAFASLRQNMQQIGMAKGLGASDQQKLRRSLSEAWLDYAFAGRDGLLLDAVNNLLQDAPDETWPEYWVLRWLNHNLNESLPESIRNTQSAIQLLPIINQPKTDDRRPVFPRVEKLAQAIDGLVQLNQNIEQLQAKGLSRD